MPSEAGAPGQAPQNPQTPEERLRMVLAMVEAGFYVLPGWTPEAWDAFLAREEREGKTARSAKDKLDGWKHPRVGMEWQNKGGRDPEQIKRWHNQNPEGNWVILCGHLYRVVMIDVDAQSGGLESMQRLCAEYGALPATWSERTPKGGYHYYFLIPEGHRLANSTSVIAPGIDIRGEGGCSVCPPSHGRGGVPYQLISRAPVSPLPLWLLDLIEQAGAAGANGGPTNAKAPPAGDGAGADREPSREPQLLAIFSHLRNRGVAPDVILQRLLKVNSGFDEPYEAGYVVAKFNDWLLNRPKWGHGARAESGESPQAGDWPDPLPLDPELPPVEPLLLEMVPQQLLPLAEDVAERLWVPLDFTAVMAIVGLAGVTNRRARIQPLVHDPTWQLPLNLWGGVVHRPGEKHTPTQMAMLEPIVQLEQVLREEHQQILAEHQRQAHLDKLRMKVWEDKAKALLRKNPNADLPPMPADPAKEPKRKRLFTTDCTEEALQSLLCDNPAGLLMIRDELSGWMAALDKHGRESERQFFMSSWSGVVPHAVDRQTREGGLALACCLSIACGIQPAPLGSYLNDAMTGGVKDDGLMQRFQMLVWPDPRESWRHIDRVPNLQALNDARELCQRLAGMDARNPVLLKFTPDAQDLFVEFLTELESEIRSGNMHPALKSHWSKYRGTAPILAALFELIDSPNCASSPVVSLQHMRQAAAWIAYLQSHARRIYSVVSTPLRRAVAEIARHLKSGWRREVGRFRLREIHHSDWAGLDDVSRIREALDVLVEYGWVRKLQPPPGPGRPPEEYLINPKLPTLNQKEGEPIED